LLVEPRSRCDVPPDGARRTGSVLLGDTKEPALELTVWKIACPRCTGVLEGRGVKAAYAFKDQMMLLLPLYGTR
jgi:hypothetical protein